MKKPVKGNAFHKLNIAVLITCVAFLCTGLCINKYYKTVLEERLMEDIDVRVVKWKDSFDRQLDNLQMAQSNLLYSQGVAKINMYWDYRSSYERMTDCVNLSDKLKEIRILYTLIDKVGIYFPQHHKVVSGNAPILESYEVDEFYDNRQCLLSDSGDLLLTTYYPLAISGKENKCVYYIRSVITASRLKTFLEQNIQIDETGFAAVADQYGRLVAVYRDKTTPQEENWENQISYELTEALKYNDNVDELRIKSDIMISGSYSKKSGLWILYGYPKNVIQDPYGELKENCGQLSVLEEHALFCTLSSQLLNAIANFLPQDNQSFDEIDAQKLSNFRIYADFSKAIKEIYEMAHVYFQARRSLHMDSRSRIVHVVNSYIKENLSKDLSMVVLGDYVGLNPAYLSRIYKETAGQSINSYISDQRTVLAKKLLKDPTIKIQKIAEMTGMRTASYFTHYFKKYVGISPQEYRNQ